MQKKINTKRTEVYRRRVTSQVEGWSVCFRRGLPDNRTKKKKHNTDANFQREVNLPRFGLAWGPAWAPLAISGDYQSRHQFERNTIHLSPGLVPVHTHSVGWRIFEAVWESCLRPTCRAQTEANFNFIFQNGHKHVI